ncbi:MAG: glycosyltransferase [Eggerthellaceae bacterium]|jgi:glycosyltransferase involved in cell wall biosynthesis
MQHAPHPTISIIVPLYNVEQYVAECLRSIATQDFEDFEVLVVDDGSDDRSVAVAKETVAGDTRFKFFAVEHGGQSVARNKGLNEATGEFVMFLDSDDYHMPHSLSRIMTEIRAHDLDLLCFTAYTLYEDKQSADALKEDMMHRLGRDEVMSGPELFIWFETCRQFWVSGPLQIVSRKLIEDHHIRLLEGAIHEDELYTVQLLTYAKRVKFLNEPLYMRRIRQGSTMTRKRGMRNITSVWRITRIMDSWIRNHGNEYPPKFVDMYARRIFELRDTMGRDSIFVDDSELDAFEQTLSPRDRVEFKLFIRQNGRNIDRLYGDMTSTTSYRVGSKIAKAANRLPLPGRG